MHQTGKVDGNDYKKRRQGSPIEAIRVCVDAVVLIEHRDV